MTEISQQVIKYYRTHNEVLESYLFPTSGISGEPGKERRLVAIYEVLRRIPEDDYQKLQEKLFDFWWFIPSIYTNAMLQPFTWTVEEEGLKPYAKVLYLSPRLERRAFDFIVACVAHELAHLLLDHTLFPKHEEMLEQEDAAWSLIRKWGFEHEEKRHEELSNRNP